MVDELYLVRSAAERVIARCGATAKITVWGRGPRNIDVELVGTPGKEDPLAISRRVGVAVAAAASSEGRAYALTVRWAR